MMRWFANNVGLRVLAVVLAFAVWLVSAWQEDPIIEDVVTGRVVVTGLDPTTTLLSNSLPTTVTTRIRAPRSVLQVLAAGGVRVDVNMADLVEGGHIILLTPTLNAEPAQVLSSQPLTTFVTIQKLVQRTLPVTVRIEGETALGFRQLQPKINPNLVTITASQQIVSQVVQVSGNLSVEGARTDVAQTVRLVARDADGSIVSNIFMEPGSVAVTVTLEQLSNYKDLAVKVERDGQPAQGYAVTGISSDPPIVTVFGARDVITALQGFIQTQPVSIANRTSDVSELVSLNVPPNVSLLSGLQVSVTIKIEPIQGARTVTSKIEVIGVPVGVRATPSPTTVDIVLAGSLPLLNSLKDQDVRVIIDAKDLKAGINVVEPQVVRPDGITVQSIQPATIQVELTSQN
jgi:YbbR domain-containing protein